MQTQPKAMDRWSDLLGARQRYKERKRESEREKKKLVDLKGEERV